ncbi:MAG: signal peptidase I [Bacilli bacterium]|nr:signal peptidase I [Bacilli bacterium]
MKKTKKFFEYFGYTIAGILILAIIAHFTLYLLGYKALVVVSGSMEPEIKTGSVIYIKTFEKNEIYDNIIVGDYITFVNNEGHNVTHEVIYINSELDQIQTQGIRDGAAPDEIISADDFVGKFVFTISYLGFVISVISSKTFIIAFISVIVIGYLTTTLIKELKKGKKEEEPTEK